MVKLFDAPLGLATGALTAFLFGSAVGILIGGFLADRTSRHDMVAACGLIPGAALSLVIASGAPTLATLPVVMALMGVCLGAISPSRDMLVRAATPPGHRARSTASCTRGWTSAPALPRSSSAGCSTAASRAWS